MPEEKRTIWVVPHPDNEDRLALWERHPEHPGGEVFVSGQDSAPVEVAVTPGVLDALAPTGGTGPNNGPPRLLEVSGAALESRRALAAQVVERKALERRQALVNAQPAAAAPATVEGNEEQTKQLASLGDRLAELEAQLAKSRDDAAKQLEEAADKASDPEERAKQVEKLDKLAVDHKEPAQVETYDYNEPVQLATDEVRAVHPGSEPGRRRENVRRRNDPEA